MNKQQQDNFKGKKDWRDIASESIQSVYTMQSDYSHVNENVVNNEINNSIESLKNSIKNNLKTYKQMNQTEGKTANANNGSININPGRKVFEGHKKSEKEKLEEFFKGIKAGSGLNISTSKELNASHDIHTNPSNDNFIIYQTFKNMLGKNKKPLASGPSDVGMEIKSPPEISPQCDQEQISIINDLAGMGMGNNNYICKYNRENAFGIVSECDRDTKLQLHEKNFYQNKYFTIKSKLKEARKKYLREKKINEMINLKLFYEMHKSSSSEKFNSTKVSSNCDEKEKENKLTKLMGEKLEENLHFFEKLENEISYKDSIIKERNEMIAHQKEMIDRLLSQFEIFLRQGSYMINDIAMLKQKIYDKNFNEVTAEFEEINKKISEYSQKIKEFSLKTFRVYEQSMSKISETNSELFENTVNFSISHSNNNLKGSKSIHSKSFSDLNKDRSMKLIELTHPQLAPQLLNSQSNISQEGGESYKRTEKIDKEIEEIFYS